jgi:hypothetical protein
MWWGIRAEGGGQVIDRDEEDVGLGGEGRGCGEEDEGKELPEHEGDF